MKVLFVIMVVLHVCYTSKQRSPKFLSIFNLVRFNNVECSSSKPERTGTCLSIGECLDGGGISGGSCAAGFGACCIFDASSCGSVVNRNCSYITNPEFPAPRLALDGCTYSISKCDPGVCSLRLDFGTFTLRGPPDLTEADGGQCSADSFQVQGLTSSSFIPVICGENSGQHIFLETTSGESDEVATLVFNFLGNGLRRWDIKVTQFLCTNANRPPQGCLQFYTGLQGRITSFNFAPTTGSIHLANQMYSVCLSRREGYCCVEFEVCRDVEDAFSLHMNGLIKISSTDNGCTEDYIQIEESSNMCLGNEKVFSNRYCGGTFNALQGLAVNSLVCDCTPPFILDIFTDGGQSSTLNLRNRGLCLDFRRRKCPLS